MCIRDSAWGDLLHFGDETAFAKLLEAAEFIDVEVGMLNAAIFVHVDGDLGVALDAGYRFDGNFLFRHGHSKCQSLISPDTSGIFPLAKSAKTAKIASALGAQPGRNTSTLTTSLIGFTRTGVDSSGSLGIFGAVIVAFRFEIGAFERGIGTVKIAHSRNTTKDCTV